MRRVILEGCNGEWAQECYLPFLIEKAAKGNIELWAVDIQPQINLSADVAALWQAVQGDGKACYVDKIRNKESYERLSDMNYVFVVTPGQYHCEIAEFWLKRLSPKGKIFIEKPLDASLESALRLDEKIGEKEGKEAVFAFDHYFARAYPFLRHKDYYLKEIGGVEKIECNILESSRIARKRANALDKGMIFDLFCHVLAVVSAVVKQNLTCSETKLQAVGLEEVKAARYVGCPISGETFAWIKLIINSNIEVLGAVGKCVGTSEDKFMKLYGPNGRIELNLRPRGSRFHVFDSQGRQVEEKELDSNPVESFLEEVLQGKEHPLSAPGVLTFDAALKILKMLDEAKNHIDRMPEYRCNESISEILGRF